MTEGTGPLTPPPPPAAPSYQSGSELLGAFTALLLRAATYPLRRPFQVRGLRPFLGKAVLWWLIGTPLLIYLSEALWLTLAYALHRPGQPLPGRVGWVQTPPAWYILAGVGLVAVLLFILDRQNETWPIRLGRRPPFLYWGRGVAPLKLPDVATDHWALGVPFDQTWSVEAHRFGFTARETVYTLNEDDLVTHAIVVAPTGMGKTYSVVLPTIEYVDRIEAAGIYLDAKGDDLTGPQFDAAYPGAFHYRFHLLEPPRSGPWFQLWAGSTPSSMAEQLADALLLPASTSEGDYFVSNQRAALVGLVDAHYLIYRRMPTLPALLQYLRSSEHRQALAKRLPGSSWEQEAILRIDELRGPKREDPLGGLDAKLAPLAHPRIARLFAPPGQGFNMNDLLRDATRVCFTLPAGPEPYVARVLGKLLVAQFTHAILDAGVSKKHLKLLVVDEAHNFITPAIAAGMAQGRSHRASYMLIFPDLSYLGEDRFITQVVGSAGLKIVMGGGSDADTERFSRLFGNLDVPMRSYTASSSEGLGQTHSSGHSAERSLGQHGGSRTRQASTGWSVNMRPRRRFTATELRELPPHYAVIERRDDQGRLTPATLVHFDRELTDAIARQQRIRRFGPDAEAFHVIPLLTLHRPAPPAPNPAADGPPADDRPSTGAPPDGTGSPPAAPPQNPAPDGPPAAEGTTPVPPLPVDPPSAATPATAPAGPGVAVTETGQAGEQPASEAADEVEELYIDPLGVCVTLTRPTGSPVPEDPITRHFPGYVSDQTYLKPDGSQITFLRHPDTPPDPQPRARLPGVEDGWVVDRTRILRYTDDGYIFLLQPAPVAEEQGGEQAEVGSPPPEDTPPASPPEIAPALPASNGSGRTERIGRNVARILNTPELGLSEELAIWLASVAADNNRDEEYIPAMIQATLADPTVRRSGSAFMHRVENNWDLPQAEREKAALPTGSAKETDEQV